MRIKVCWRALNFDHLNAVMRVESPQDVRLVVHSGHRCTDNFRPAPVTTASKVFMVGLPFKDSAR